MEITKSQLDAYRSRLDDVRYRARVWAKSELSAWMGDHPSASVAETREEAKRVVGLAAEIFGDEASMTALALVEAVMSSAGLSGDVGIATGWVDDSKLDHGVRADARFLVDGEAGKFVDKVADRAGNLSRRGASETVTACSKSVPGLGWARVPSGAETCGFCYILASRGFVYESEKTASSRLRDGHAYHDHCDCVAVPASASDTVEGYDPDLYYGKYAEARLACKSGNIKDIAKEIESRGAEWMYSADD